jgi:hypothetical protein
VPGEDRTHAADLRRRQDAVAAALRALYAETPPPADPTQDVGPVLARLELAVSRLTTRLDGLEARMETLSSAAARSPAYDVLLGPPRRDRR